MISSRQGHHGSCVSPSLSVEDADPCTGCCCVQESDEFVSVLLRRGAIRIRAIGRESYRVVCEWIESVATRQAVASLCSYHGIVVYEILQ